MLLNSYRFQQHYGFSQYLNCRGDASPSRVSIPLSRLSVPPLRFSCHPIEIWALDDQRKKTSKIPLNIAPNSAEKVIQKEKHFNHRQRPFFFLSSPNFGEKTLQFLVKTFLFWSSPNFGKKTLQFSVKTFFFWSSPNFGEKTLQFLVKTFCFFFFWSSPNFGEKHFNFRRRPFSFLVFIQFRRRNYVSSLRFGQGCKSVSPCNHAKFYNLNTGFS